jgi:flagellin
MVINTNVSALNSSRLLASSSHQLSKSLARLSSGSKIVNPEDDAAGLGVSMKLQAQINRNSAALTNVNNSISFSQTQDGFLSKVFKALDRMSELSVLAQDQTKTTNDLSNYDSEYQQLISFMQDVSTKEFNGVALFGTGFDVTTGSDGETYTMLDVELSDITGASFGDLTTQANGATENALLDDVIQTLSSLRGNVGTNIQRLSLESEQLSILNENLSAANSRIIDVDVAQESTNFARYNILVQSGTAMLAQANMLPQSALRLLG